MPTGTQERFEVLDSLRGLCALIVAVHHFGINGVIANLPIMRNGWIFVDFFFVLSGFVIANAYGERLATGTTPVGRFMALRMGRIYPLHFVVLAAFFALEIAKITASVGERSAFTDGYSPGQLVSSLLLLHSFDGDGTLRWNAPSWSIAAEMWTYLLFAAVYAAFGRRGFMIFALAGLAALIVLATVAPIGLRSAHDFGFVRCVFGFALGVGVHWLYERGVRIGGDLAEWLTLLAVIVFVSWLPEGHGNLIGPFLFGATVLVFAANSGSASRLLELRPLVLLGTLSYSIYMVHTFVQQRFNFIVKRVGVHFDITMAEFPDGARAGMSRIVASPLVADALTLGMIAIVVIAAAVSYNLVERPAREWTRARLAGREKMRT